MNDLQTNRVNSLIKSSDFLDDNTTEVSTITQIPPLAAELITIIQDIETAAGKGSLNLTGVAEQKAKTRKNLEDIVLKVARGASAYYQSVDQLPELRIVNFNSSEIIRKRDNDLYATTKELHQMAVADGTNYIGIVAGDITLMMVQNEKFFDYIQDPKRAKETAAEYNASIDPLITQGMEVRTKIDIYMQTFIATNEFLYNVWKASLGIDDTGANTPSMLTISVALAPGEVKNVDFSAITLQGNTDIKLINNTAGALIYGFGSNDNSFVNTDTVLANSQKRKSAASLGFDTLTNIYLNIKNENGIDLDCTLEFYDMS